MTDGLSQAGMKIGSQENVIELGENELTIVSPQEKEILDMFPNAIAALEKVTSLGAVKHGKGSWAKPENPSLQTVANSNSMFHHLAEHFMGLDKDPESGVDPLLHLAWRALAKYERKVQGIEDE